MQSDLIPVDENGDVKVAVGDCKFLVSSSKMSALSPKFHELFSPKEILLFEDPVTFHIICQSAHGVFIPQSAITTDNLVNLAAAMRKYDIPFSSPLRATINFCFTIQSLQSKLISTAKLLKLVQIAKSLDPLKLEQLLLNIFHHSNLRCEKLAHGDEDKDCALLLASVLLKVANTRAEVASSLLRASDTEKYESAFAKEVHDIGVWTVKHHPSLRELDLRLDKLRGSQEPSIHGIIESEKEKILLAAADIKQLVSNGIGADPESETERRHREIFESDAYEEIGFEQLKIEGGRKSAELNKASSAQHLSDEEFGSSSTVYSDEDYVDYFHSDVYSTPPYVFMSKSI